LREKSPLAPRLSYLGKFSSVALYKTRKKGRWCGRNKVDMLPKALSAAEILHCVSLMDKVLK